MRALTMIALVCGLAAFAQERPAGIDEAIAQGPDAFLEQAVVGPRGDGAYVVPTTQIVQSAGQMVEFPGRPVDMALSPDGAILAIKNRQDVVFMEPARREIVQTLKFPKGGATFCGIAWSRDGSRVWVTDTESFLRAAARDSSGAFAWVEEIPLPGPERDGKNNATPGGILLDDDAGLAYVTLSRNNTVGVVNLAEKRLDSQIPVGIAPYTLVRIGAKAYVTNWGGRVPTSEDVTGPTSGSKAVVDPGTGIASTGTVSIIDLAAKSVVKEIAVGLHPSEMAVSHDGARLYVANANSDTVSVIDTTDDEVVDALGVKPMAELPFGSAPNALLISPDGATLYVANGGNNALAVIDLPSKRVKGLIPTGWYPGSIVLLPDGTLCVANTKGVGSRFLKANPTQKAENFGSERVGYNSHDHMGSITFVGMPDDEELVRLTIRTAANMRLPNMHTILTQGSVEEKRVPVPTRPGEVSHFKHVLYIIKENRTYDQVFGDLPQGNGDPSLCQFGRAVTPNHHALAEEFVLFDNFYCNGILSADGHQWTDEGYVTDYLERSFGGFTRSYPYDGDDALAYASSGFIWDHVLRKGLTFRNYGEFIKAEIEPKDASWTDIYQDFLNGTRHVKIRATTLLHTLRPYICPDFIGFPGKMQDVYRAQIFLEELRVFEEVGQLPNFIIMLLPNDHTSGTRPGMPTPRAAVADNDLALGRIVEAVTKSKFWPDTVIFVVEDDPQAGLDHVDGHRTVALCISPYTKRTYVDSSHYTQTSMLRTMELIFGLSPMNQLTMAANPMLACFQEQPDLTPYQARPNTVPLNEMNPDVAALQGLQRELALKSLAMPLDDIDQADEGLFNRILWHSVKGYDVPYPELTRKAEAGAEAWPGVVPHEEKD